MQEKKIGIRYRSNSFLPSLLLEQKIEVLDLRGYNFKMVKYKTFNTEYITFNTE